MPLPTKVVLYGAGSSVIVDIEETCLRQQIEIVAVIKNFDGPSYALHPHKIVHLVDVTDALLQHNLLFPLFTPGHRKYARDQAITLGGRCFEPIVDPTATLPTSLDIHAGVYINSGTIIGGKTTLGAFSFINRGVSLGHHSSVSEFASIGPSVVTGAHIKIGRGAVIGAGAVILPKISIGANAVVGGGAVVTRDVPDNVLVMGNPARIMKENILGYNGVGV